LWGSLCAQHRCGQGRYRAVPCRPLQPRQEQDPIGACAPFSLCVGARHLRSFFSLVQVQLRITGFVGTGRSQATQVASPPAAPRAPAPSRAPPRLSACFFVCVPCVAPSRFLSAVWRPAADSYLSPSALRVRELQVASCCPCFALAEWNFALLRRCSYFRHLCMGSSSSRSSLQIDFERQVQQPVLASFRF